VEPQSRLGQAIADRLDHGDTLTRVLQAPGAPLDTHVAERALKLAIRQRQTSFFYAAEPRAYLASVLTRVSAPGVQAGVTALDSRVARQDHRQEVRAHPRAWLPWNSPTAVAPP
jgi:transposase